MSSSLVSSGRYRIHSFRVSGAEEMAVIVDGNGIPARMPLRWLVQKRRGAAGSYGALLTDLQGVLDLYRWAEQATSVVPHDLDDFLASGGTFNVTQLWNFWGWVRTQEVKRGGSKKPQTKVTTSRRIGSAVRFLEWAADVHGWGGAIRIPPTELIAYQNRLRITFENDLKSPKSARPQPLSPDEDETLRRLIRPKLGPGGALVGPVQFPD